MNEEAANMIRYYTREESNQVLNDHGELSGEALCKLRFEA